MRRLNSFVSPSMCLPLAVAAVSVFGLVATRADSIPTTILDSNLEVTTFLGGAGDLSQPIGIVFIGQNDAFVLEKASGQVKRVVGGVLQSATVLDLAVNSNSERGLLSLALDPNFAENHFV